MHKIFYPVVVFYFPGTVCRGGRLFIIIFQGLFYYFIILGFTKCHVEECYIVECVLWYSSLVTLYQSNCTFMVDNKCMSYLNFAKLCLLQLCQINSNRSVSLYGIVIMFCFICQYFSLMAIAYSAPTCNIPSTAPKEDQEWEGYVTLHSANNWNQFELTQRNYWADAIVAFIRICFVSLVNVLVWNHNYVLCVLIR